MGKNSFYLGEVGNASKMNLVLQTMVGGTSIYLALKLSTAKLWWAGGGDCVDCIVRVTIGAVTAAHPPP